MFKRQRSYNGAVRANDRRPKGKDAQAASAARSEPRAGAAAPKRLFLRLMCNRYASDIRKAGKERDYYGFDEWSETRINPLLGNAVLEVFPKSYGPVLKLNEKGELEWSKMRWGLPGPPQLGGAPVTNIRNIKSPLWRPLLGAAHRCLVPFSAFSEYEDASPKGKKQIRWFAPPGRGLLYFAGVWRQWDGTMAPRKSRMSARIFCSAS